MGPGFGDQERLRMLRMQIEQRWGRMVQQQLQLDDQQMDRLRTAIRANQDRRRDLMRRQADLERAIGGQMQPGVAANSDSLNRMLEGMGRLRLEHAQSDQQFMRELGFLTPVQRARFFMMQRRFEERMREIRRRGPGGPGAPGARPMLQPMRPARPWRQMRGQPPESQAPPAQRPPRP
jgi:Spy/CpxP family protein refolding chaperone